MSLYDRLTSAAEELFVAQHPDTVERLRSIPGPHPTFPLGNVADFIGNKPWEVFARYVREYGGLLKWWKLGEPVLVVTDPALTEAIFIDRVADFYKKSPVKELTPLLSATEPFISNLPAWKTLAARSIFSMKGYGPWLAQQAPMLAACGREALSARIDGEAADALEFAHRLGFAAFSRMAIGSALDDDSYCRLMRMAKEGDERLSTVLPLGDECWDPGFCIARSGLRETFADAIVESRSNLDPARDDALALALREGSALDDDALATALQNLYFGGLFSTTSTWLSCLHELTNHPDVLARVRAELEPIVRRSGYDGAALAGSPALEQAIRETLRLRGAVPIVTRNTAPDREVELGGHVLPPDTTIFLSSYAVHLDPRSWPDADEFLPARWSPDVIAANPYGSGKFWPFGRGPRACAGRDFALAYLRATLAVAIVELDVQVGKGQKFEGEMFFACMAAKGLEMSVAKR